MTLVSACAYRASPPFPTDTPMPYPRPHAIFNYEKTKIWAEIKPSPAYATESHETFNVFFTFNAPVIDTKHETMRGQYLRLKKPGSHGIIIVAGVPNNITFPQNSIRETFTEWIWPEEYGFRNFHLLILDTGAWPLEPARFKNARAEKIFNEYDNLKEYLRTIVIAIRRSIDWAETRPEIDPARIGITGASTGGIFAALAMGADSRIASGLFMMTGGNIGRILTESTEKDARVIRNETMRKLGWTKEELGHNLAIFFYDVEPLVWASRIPPRPTEVFIAEFDEYIPPSSGWELWQNLKSSHPPLIFYASHKAAFVGMTIIGGYRMNYEIYRFFSKTLK
ncbi:MAG: hypothetical protein Q7R73_05485 [bacterium]|nr:hypothetical protein [bacterium]